MARKKKDAYIHTQKEKVRGICTRAYTKNIYSHTYREREGGGESVGDKGGERLFQIKF